MRDILEMIDTMDGEELRATLASSEMDCTTATAFTQLSIITFKGSFKRLNQVEKE